MWGLSLLAQIATTVLGRDSSKKRSNCSVVALDGRVLGWLPGRGLPCTLRQQHSRGFGSGPCRSCLRRTPRAALHGTTTGLRRPGGRHGAPSAGCQRRGGARRSRVLGRHRRTREAVGSSRRCCGTAAGCSGTLLVVGSQSSACFVSSPRQVPRRKGFAAAGEV